MMRSYNFKNTITLAALITLCRLFYLYINHINLHPDEAQYWVWSQELALGYYSKPPVIAWLIALSTGICGHSEFCIRAPSPLLYFAATILIYQLAEYLWDKKTGFYSALGFLLLPGVTFSAGLMTTDVPLLFSFAGALLFFAKALGDDKWWNWLALGFFVGIGLLTKYTMAVFILSASLYILVVMPNRLKSLKPWVSAAVGFLLFLPNLIWNIHSRLVSFQHTGANLNPEQSGFNLAKFAEFLAAQIAIFGPILFAFFVFILLFRFREIKQDQRYRLLYYSFLPLLLITLAVAFTSRAHGNWAAPIYVPATILVTAWMTAHGKDFWLRATLILHLAIALFLLNYDQINSHLHLKFDPFARLRGWNEFAQNIDEEKMLHPTAAIFTDERKIAASLSYYIRDQKNNPAAIYKWNPHDAPQDYFAMARNMDDEQSHDFIFITRSDEISNIEIYFASSTLEKTLLLPANPKLKYRIYYMKNFAGY